MPSELEASTDVYSYDQIADFLTDNFWDSYGGARSFNASAGDTITYNVSGLTQEGQNLAEDAFDAWSMVTGLVFIETTSFAQITLNDQYLGAYASMSTSGGNIVSASINISESWIGGSDRNDGYGFQTYMHEIGHALGLGHAGNYNGSANYGTDNDYANDSWQASLMSYFHQTENPTINASFAYTLTPMIADIIAIQNLYGAGGGNPGNTIYGDGGNTGTYLDTWMSMTNPIALTIYDGSGTDLIDLRSNGSDQRLALAAEAISDVNGLIGNLIIARGADIENAKTGSGDDTVDGNALTNDIDLGAGNDEARGGIGFDRIVGGSGADRLWGGANADNLFGGTGNDALYGDAGADRLSGEDGRDTLDGGDGDDVGWAGLGNDQISGGDGNDRFYGGAGDDLMDGDAGADNIFAESGQDTVDGGLGDDTLWAGSGEDEVRGGDGNDEIYGEAGFDLLYGGDGDDVMDGGAQADNIFGELGNDTLTGGDGLDRLFGGEGNDDLDGQDGNDGLFGESGNDHLKGGAGNDRFFGGTGNDLVDGGTGSDTLRGDAGFDRLIGGEGNDTISGNFNADTFVFEDGSDQDTVTDFDALNIYEKIDLSGMTAIVDYADLTASHIFTSGSNVVIDAGSGDVITLVDVDIGDLDTTDFLF
ncbi:MAG: M10 family metallopeptidase [Pseudomonadota bacterium]